MQSLCSNIHCIKPELLGGTKSGFTLQYPVLRISRNVSLIAMEQGTIARLTDRGFGFISREGQDKDLFFHSNELQNVQFNELKEGDQVSFEVAEGPKGPNAIKVNRA